MKKRKLLTLASLALCFALVGCDDIVAEPANGDDPLINFTDTSETYFQNDYMKVYDQLVDDGQLNTYTLKKLIQTIVKDKVDNSGFFGDTASLNSLKRDLIDEEMLSKVNSSSYKKDDKFYESKFIRNLASSLYNVSITNTHEGIYIKPDTTIDEILGDKVTGERYVDFNESGELIGPYATYIKNEVLPDINEKLLIAKYICENSFTALGRAYARKVSYVKLENIDKQPGAVGKLINTWLGNWVKEGKTTTEDNSFDVNSLARIYKGLPENDLEKAFIEENNIYTLKDQIQDEINKIAETHEDEEGNIVIDSMIADKDIDTTIEDKYTGTGTYPIEKGYADALATLSSNQISDSDLYTKTNGISDLPSTITDRIFSSSIGSYVSTSNGVSFLTPATIENGSDLGKYYFYDSSTSAYYIVVIESYNYTSTNLKSDVVYDTDGTTIKSISNEVARVALELSSSSTYKNEALLAVFDEYDIADHIHDQTFYDYMESNYADLFDD